MTIHKKSVESNAAAASHPENGSDAGFKTASQKQLRGGSLLLVGKIFSAVILFGTQVLMVYYLDKANFGAWMYTLTMVNVCRTFASLGLKNSVSRFIPIYHEKNQYDKIFGLLLLVIVTIAGTAAIVISGVYFLPEFTAYLIKNNTQIHDLILILIFLMPLDSLDETTVGLFASFSGARLIFWGKHVLVPGLRFLMVVGLVLIGSDIFFLAYAYVASTAASIGIYIWMFLKLLRQKGVLQHFSWKSVVVPFKEVFGFTIPLLTTDLLLILMYASDTLILGYYYGAEEVASYQVILPAARFNQMVMTSFSYMYVPLAARLFARKEYEAINKLYWQTAMWMAVLSFPVFVLTVSMAQPLTRFFYGVRYEESWIFLNCLAVGFGFNVFVGFNGLTMKVFGRIRYVMTIDLIAAVLNIAANFLLIPRIGALGAAISTGGTLILYGILKHVGLSAVKGLKIFNRDHLTVFFTLALTTLLLFAIQYYTRLHFLWAVALTALGAFLVLRVARKRLEIEETFPELIKIPLLKWILNPAKKKNDYQEKIL